MDFGRIATKVWMVSFLFCLIATTSTAYPITYYEHLSTQKFNSTTYLGTIQSRSTVFPSSTSTNGWNFTKDIAEISPNGLLLTAGTISFNGSFKANTNQDKNDVYINWQLVEYNSTSGAETEICRTPTGTNGKLVTSTSATNLSANCTIASDYRVKPGNYLRANIYGYNVHPTQTKDITHIWDNSSYPGTYQLQQQELGNLSVSITSPSSPLMVFAPDSFNISCNTTCNNGSCINVSVFVDFRPPSGSWQAISSSGNIVLNGTETNPQNIGNLSGSNNTVFIVSANIISNNNTVRCRSESAYSNATGQTELQVNISDSIPPVVSIQFPQNSNYNISILNLNYLSGDNVALDSCWYSLNGDLNTTLPGCSNTSITAVEGSNTITVFANDSAGNTNSSTVSFSVDTIPPSISIQSPANATYNSTSLNLNFTASGQSECWHILNNGSPVSGCSNTSITAAEGSNTITVYANDSAGNTNSSTVSFVVNSGSLITPNQIYSSGGSKEKKIFDVEWKQVCPDDRILVNVQSNGNPAIGVQVRLIHYIPYSGLVDQVYTNQSGKATFTSAGNGSYHIYVSGSGYSNNGPIAVQYTSCEIKSKTESTNIPIMNSSNSSGSRFDYENGFIGNATQGVGKSLCLSDGDCLDEELCREGACIPVEPKTCGYISNHSSYDYQCCADKDCTDYPYSECKAHFCSPKEYAISIINDTIIVDYEATIGILEDNGKMAFAKVSVYDPSGKEYYGYTNRNGVFTFIPNKPGAYIINALGKDGRLLAQRNVTSYMKPDPSPIKRTNNILRFNMFYGLYPYRWLLQLIGSLAPGIL